MTPDEVERGELIRRIELGLDVEKALSTPIARYLCRRAEQHRQAALESLAGMDPEMAEGRTMIRRAQTEIAAMDRWQEWLAEAVQEGNAAQLVLIESEQSAPI